MSHQRMLLLIVVLLSPTSVVAKQLAQGLVSSAPEGERSVKTDAGFMVAYTETIPGTDVTFTMVPIPGGEYPFKRGDQTLTVRIEPFWMAATEVTWAEYRQYMRLATVFEKFNDRDIRTVSAENAIDTVTAPSKIYDASFTFENGAEPNQPAISMTQYAAKQYTKWLSLLSGRYFRLPSEAEWEYACRAGSDARYSFGEDPDLLDEYAWYDDMNDYQTGQVGTKKPNAWGLYDMHGNAAEWVLDAGEPPADSPSGAAAVSVEEAIAWPTRLYPRVLKGGSWDSPAEECTCTSRIESHDDWQANDPNTPKSPWWFASYYGQLVGFRIVRPLEVPDRELQEKYWEADIAQIAEHASRRIEEEGRGERGLVDPELADAIESVNQP